MILDYRSSVPSHPPQKSLIILIIINIVLLMNTKYIMFYEVFIYLYGIMTLISLKQINYNQYFNWTVFSNIIMICIDFLFKIKLTRNQQLIFFIIICSAFTQLIWKSVVDLFNSIQIGTDITFSQAFIVIQCITVNKFVVYFTDIQILRNLPMYIRIIQNLKINSSKSLKAIFRFQLIILTSYLPNTHFLNILLKTIICGWKIYNDFRYTFKMQRLYYGQFRYFPNSTFLIMFSINIICRICWIFSPTYSVFMSVLRKLIQNYFRLQSQSASRKEEDITRAIIKMTKMENIII